MKTLLYIFVLFSTSLISLEKKDEAKFIHSAKRFNAWDYKFSTGLSLTKIPLEVVEEEINQSPLIVVNARFGLPLSLSLKSQFEMNVLTNSMDLELMWSKEFNSISTALSTKSKVWIGNLDFNPFDLNATGLILYPTFKFSIDKIDYILTFEIESQTSWIFTRSNEIQLGQEFSIFNGIGVSFIFEQPLWNNNWVVNSIKFNYVKSHYQSWLSYSTIDEFFLYPEFTFSFIL